MKRRRNYTRDFLKQYDQIDIFENESEGFGVDPEEIFDLGMNLWKDLILTQTIFLGVFDAFTELLQKNQSPEALDLLTRSMKRFSTQYKLFLASSSEQDETMLVSNTYVLFKKLEYNLRELFERLDIDFQILGKDHFWPTLERVNPFLFYGLFESFIYFLCLSAKKEGGQLLVELGQSGLTHIRITETFSEIDLNVLSDFLQVPDQFSSSKILEVGGMQLFTFLSILRRYKWSYLLREGEATIHFIRFGDMKI